MTPGTAACQASLSVTNSQSLLKLMSIELVMPSNHLSLCRPLLLLLSVRQLLEVVDNSCECAFCMQTHHSRAVLQHFHQALKLRAAIPLHSPPTTRYQRAKICSHSLLSLFQLTNPKPTYSTSSILFHGNYKHRFVSVFFPTPLLPD